MKLVVYELTESGITQELTVARNTIVESVRPHIYRHNFATGSLKIQIIDSEDDVIAESESVDIADILGPDEEDFFHGYVRFDINAGLKKDETYKFKLVGEGGYTFDEAAYIGWCNGFDLGKYDESYVVDHRVLNALDLEIWERLP